MGDLVVMSRAKPLPTRDIVVGHSAEILFFTGVRYYRMDEPAEAVQAELPKPKRRRSPDHRRTAKLTRGPRRKALA